MKEKVLKLEWSQRRALLQAVDAAASDPSLKQSREPIHTWGILIFADGSRLRYSVCPMQPKVKFEEDSQAAAFFAKSQASLEDV